MAQPRGKISARDAADIARLEARLGSLRFRTLISDTGGSKRLVKPERLSKWQSGRGTLSQAERERLALINSNANLIENLGRKNQGKKGARVNRALRDWLAHGKAKDVEFDKQEAEAKKRQLRAIKALRYLGVDPSEGTYYVRKRVA